MAQEAKAEEPQTPEEEVKEPKPAAPKNAPKQKSFQEALKECSTLLINAPDALDFGVKKDEGSERHYYSFANISDEAKAVRSEITAILKELYNNGMYSYRQFAEPLRVEGLSIQALLDDEFIELNNL